MIAHTTIDGIITDDIGSTRGIILSFIQGDMMSSNAHMKDLVYKKNIKFIEVLDVDETLLP